MKTASSVFEIHEHLGLHKLESRNITIRVAGGGGIVSAIVYVCKSCGHVFTPYGKDYFDIKTTRRSEFLSSIIASCKDFELDPYYEVALAEQIKIDTVKF
jgi:hypothetical protein